MNLGNAMGEWSFVMSASFTNQTLAQLEYVEQSRHLQERGLHPAEAARSKVARLHLVKVSTKLTKLTSEQARLLSACRRDAFKPKTASATSPGSP